MYKIVLPFPHGLSDDLSRRPKEQSRHQSSDDKVGPCGSREVHSCRCPHDGNIADGVVSAAEPHGPDVRITILKSHQLEDTNQVGRERQDANGSHDRRGWNAEDENLIDG